MIDAILFARPGESHAYAKPIVGLRDGYFSGIFSPNFVRAAQNYPEVPRMTAKQDEALELFKALTEERALGMSFEPGGIQSAQQPPDLSLAHELRRLRRARAQAIAAETVVVRAERPCAARRLGARLRHQGGGCGPGRGAEPRRLARCQGAARPPTRGQERFAHRSSISAIIIGAGRGRRLMPI